jgi:hypothetical protein
MHTAELLDDGTDDSISSLTSPLASGEGQHTPAFARL